jgi:DNA-binding transcriptional LysR family regulator
LISAQKYAIQMACKEKNSFLKRSCEEVPRGGHLDLRQLRYLRCVVECRSFTRAADVLGIAQPALSLHVKNLELELGVQLLVRHSRGVSPTSACETLVERAIEILDELENIKRSMMATAQFKSHNDHLAMARPLV